MMEIPAIIGYALMFSLVLYWIRKRSVIRVWERVYIHQDIL